MTTPIYDQLVQQLGDPQPVMTKDLSLQGLTKPLPVADGDGKRVKK